MARKVLPEQLRVPWTVWQGISVFLLAWLVVPLAVLAIVHSLAPILPAAAALMAKWRANDVGVNFGLDLINAVAALGLVAMYLRRYDVPWAAVGWRKVGWWRSIGYVLLVFVSFIVLAGTALWLISVLDPSFNANQTQTNDFTDAAPSHRSLTLIALVLIPPVIEETVFRGFIFPAVAKHWGLVWGAILSSALFGIAHMQANISVYTFVLGLVLCFLYVKTKSIFPGMAVHLLNNFLAYYALTSK